MWHRFDSLIFLPFSPIYTIMHLLVPTGTGDTPHVVTTQPLFFVGATILVTMVLLLLVIIISISAGVLIGRLVYKTWISECWSCNGKLCTVVK